ncbi:MAG: hypothetical protein ACTHLW_12490 [Verrucomicrobiota bacterium]
MQKIIFAIALAASVAGCDRSSTTVEKSAKPGLQPGEMYDSGGYSLTNPIHTNALPGMEGTNSGTPGGPVRAP